MYAFTFNLSLSLSIKEKLLIKIISEAKFKIHQFDDASLS
jgi:hypothetical protein